MKKIILNLLVLFFWVSAVIYGIVLLTPKDTQNYLAAAIDKRNLLVNTPSPRIILVGGSNLAFSVDSEELEKQFGVPVINMGLHAGLGLRYMVDEIIPYIREGDIVIIIPEYEHFSSLPLDGRPSELGPVIKLCPQCVLGIRTPIQAGNVVVGILPMIEGDVLQVFKGTDINTDPDPDQVYSREGFNRFGDVVTHLNLSSPNELGGRFTQSLILTPNPAIKFLNSSQVQIERKGARCFFMFPAVPEKDFNVVEKDLLAFENLLQTELDIPILGKMKDFVFPEDFFYDSIYHMNKIGRYYRTNLMIELINAGLKQ